MNSTLDEIVPPGKPPHVVGLTSSALEGEGWVPMDVAVGGLTVGEAAAHVGLSVHTLRWYEQEGLVSPVDRDTAGRRRYRPEDLDWLRLLICLRGTGRPGRGMAPCAPPGATGAAPRSERG